MSEPTRGGYEHPGAEEKKSVEDHWKKITELHASLEEAERAERRAFDAYRDAVAAASLASTVAYEHRESNNSSEYAAKYDEADNKRAALRADYDKARNLTEEILGKLDEEGSPEQKAYYFE